MAALSAERNTVRQGADVLLREFDVPLAASKVYKGGIAVLNSSGYGAAGSTATGLTAWGVWQETVDNSGGSAGDLKAKCRRGAFWFGNSASTDAITRAEIGDNCYIVDDQTVAKTDGSSSRSVAGKILDVDSSLGVLVEFK